VDDAACGCAGRSGPFVGEEVGGSRHEREFQAWRSFEQEKQTCAHEIHSCFRYGERTGGARHFGAGGWRAALRKAARADAGDEVSVTLRLDRESREPIVPGDLRMALKENPEARKIFEALTAGHRRHIVEWFDSARGMDTRIRRLGFTIEFLLKRRRKGSRDRRRAAKRGQPDE
jgi:hypothetical protein